MDHPPRVAHSWKRKLRMSALTKTTARKTRKKPATRSVIKTGKVARRQPNVPRGKTKRKPRNSPTRTTRSGKKSKTRAAKIRKKATKSSARKLRLPLRATHEVVRRTKPRANRAEARRATNTRKSRRRTASKSHSRIAAGEKLIRPLRRLKSRVRPKITGKDRTKFAKRGRAAQEKLRSRQLRSKHQERKEKDRIKKQREKERERLLKLRAQEKLRKQRDAELSRKQRTQERARRQREQLALRAARAKELRQRAREEKRKKQQERDSKRQAEIRAREEERRRSQFRREEAKRAKEEERQRLKAEREAEREQARRQKEEERAKREAEREAYRKAKEAERERLRATREAQKRALEGRIAEATRNANKLGGGRSTTTRFYSPRAIPNQSGTTRRVSDALTSVTNSALANGIQLSDAQAQSHEVNSQTSGSLSGDETPRVPAPPERPLPTAESVEERFRIIEERLKESPADFRHGYQEALDMSWIYHDSALEGVVYTFQELRAAIDQGTAAVADSSLQPVVEEVRRHKAAIDLVREMGEKKRAPITVDVIRKIYLTLHPEEGDLKTVKYRRDIPQHRLYFHEYAHPEKIQHKVRQIVDWLNGPEPKKLKSPIRVASRAHYELLRVFPFQSDSGKLARLFMNLLLLRAGHPPAIVHSTERQRYYEALRGALPTLIQMVTESILNGLVSIEKLLDDQEAKVRTNAS